MPRISEMTDVDFNGVENPYVPPKVLRHRIAERQHIQHAGLPNQHQCRRNCKQR